MTRADKKGHVWGLVGTVAWAVAGWVARAKKEVQT